MGIMNLLYFMDMADASATAAIANDAI